MSESPPRTEAPSRRPPDQELRESEERFRLLVESVKDYAIFMLDPDGRVTSWNAGAEAIKGYRAAEVLGRHFSCFYPPEAVAAGWPTRELELASALGRFEDEGWRLRRDGTAFWANVVISAIHDAQGRLRGFAKVTRDLTDRRRAESLEADRDRINEFLAMLGHELRNPLASIRNAASVLFLQPSEEAARWAAGVLERQSAQLTRLVDDLLDSARIVNGRIEIERLPTNLAAVVRRAVEAASPLIEARGQELDVELPPGPMPIFADLARLSQAVLNLLNNAARYTPAGGRIRIRAENRGETLELRIEDNGAGIAPELLPRVFDLFVQGNRALDREEGGLGIGLALVKRIVELHGGEVEVSSPGVGCGTVARLRLPLVERMPAGPVRAVEPRRAAARRKVLVVDDNTDSAETMCALVSAWGHEARRAADGPEALAAAAAERPDIVLLDIGLPGMDGFEVARRLRDLRLEPEPTLIAMTGYGRDEDRRESHAAGFDHHLVKPLNPDELASLLEGAPRGGPGQR